MLKVDEKRLEKNIHDLGKIGSQEGRGTTRIAYSPEYEKGRDLVKAWMEDAGMKTRIDPVGNLIGRLEGIVPGEKIVAMGSHIDSVPEGGIYDGAYGVLAAIECVKTLTERKIRLRYPMEVIAFIDEEGTAVGGTFGSKCFIGMSIEHGMHEQMKEYGISDCDLAACANSGRDYQAYFELHIEQGAVLEYEKKEIGVAKGIVGILRYQARVKGLANHAGTTPMNLRKDAMEGSCRIILQLLDEVRNRPEVVCTVGQIEALPGSYNIIPGEVHFTIDLRGPDMKLMQRLIRELQDQYADILEIEEYVNQPPTHCDQRLQDTTRESVKKLKLTSLEMFSGAGHDLINMALITPSALIFIPSRGGISHCKDEYSSMKSMADGANVLLNNLLELNKGGGL